MLRYGNGCLVGEYGTEPFAPTNDKTSRKLLFLSLASFAMFIMIPTNVKVSTNAIAHSKAINPAMRVEIEKLAEANIDIEDLGIYENEVSDAISNQLAHDDSIVDAIAERKSTNNMTEELAVCRPAEEKAVYHAVVDEAYMNPTIIQATYNYNYVPSSGGCLTPTNGVFNGPSGKETYYNLDMSVIVQVAHSNGIEGDYWIREDGVKMLGSYVMCACNRDVHPYGTLVETSLGTGISLDTGGFAANNPTQIDIAVAW